MPKFLIITILIMVFLGQIFSVNEYTSIPESEKNIQEKKTLLESNVDEIYIEKVSDSGFLEVVRVPESYEDSYFDELSELTDNKDGCLYFEENIPKIDSCQD